jgi:uncharacterized protein YlxW (UPF0749 family)
MNPFEMVVVVIAIVMAATIIIKRMELQGKSLPKPEDRVENDKLRGQVQQLQDRIKVLEKIVTDRGAETAAQIEALRDRDRISEEDKA